MRVATNTSANLLSIPFTESTAQGPKSRSLGVELRMVSPLPGDLDAILIAGDLQGRVDVEGSSALLATVVAERVCEIATSSPTTCLGVLLAGDFYADEHARGCPGDVAPVWGAFLARAAWVSGCAGNHDLFGMAPRRPHFEGFLDGDIIERSGIRIAGISGLIGRPGKPWRQSETEYRVVLERLLRQRLDILVVHEGPDAGPGCPGSSLISQCLASAASQPLVICGHAQRSRVLAEIPRPSRPPIHVLNADGAAIVLRAGC